MLRFFALLAALAAFSSMAFAAANPDAALRTPAGAELRANAGLEAACDLIANGMPIPESSAPAECSEKQIAAPPAPQAAPQSDGTQH